jgi:hypothetical protein
VTKKLQHQERETYDEKWRQRSKANTANDQGAGPATPVSPASSAQDECCFWGAVPGEEQPISDALPDIENEYQRRLAGLKVLPRRQRSAAYRAAKEWFRVAIADERARKQRDRAATRILRMI